MKKNTQTVTLPQPIFWEKYMHIILCATAFLLYANTIGNGYNMDDELVTRKHKLASKGISAIPEIFTSSYYSDNMGYSYEYRPVVLTSFAIEHQFFGDKPAVSHFLNVLLYVLTVFILFKLLRKLLHAYSYWYSVLVVLLFIVHPLHSEVVASIKNRDEVLALLGALGAWWFALGFSEKGKWWQAMLTSLLFLGAALSKMSIVPCLLIIPISIVFFKPVTGGRILLISLLLSVPIYPFLSIAGKFDALFMAAYMAAILLPWFTLRLKGDFVSRSFTSATQFVRGIKVRMQENMPVSANSSQALFALRPLGFLRSELLQIPFVVGVGLLLVGSGVYIWWPVEYLPVFWFLFFGLMFLVGNHSQRTALIPLFTVMFLWVCYVSYHSFYIDLGLGFLLFVYLLYPAIRNTILILCIALFLSLYIYVDLVFDYFSLLILFIPLMLRDKNRFFSILAYVVGLVALVIVISNITGVIQGDPWENIVAGIVLFSCILLVVIRKGMKIIVPFLLIAAIPFIHPVKEGDKRPKIETTAVSATVKGKPATDDKFYTLLPEEQRPIQFAELPITDDTPAEDRMGLAADVMGFYLKKMFLPYPLGYYYGYAFFKPDSIFSLWPMVSLFLHISLLALSFLVFKRQKLLSFGIWFYLVAIALFSGLFYPVVGVAGDRFSYLASVGFAMAIAYALIRLSMGMEAIVKDIKPSKPLMAIICTIIIVYGFLTLNRNTLWSDQITLMSHDIEYLDESSQAHNLYALSLMRESFENKKLRPDQQLNMRKTAVLHFDKAIQIWPAFFNAAYDKGRSATIIGDVNSAIDGYEKAVNIGTEDDFIDPYIQLGQLYLQVGRHKDFLVNAKKLLEKDKKAEAFNMVARGFYLNGNSDSAKIYLRKGMGLNPGEVSLKKNMAEIFKAESQLDSMNYWLAQ